ncbi:MAG: DUF4126 domain-containing protein [Anaerolineae bacterium]
MDTLLSIFLGIGLSAATGFRVFVPLLIMNIAAQMGHLQLAPGFEWIGSTTALIVLGVAAVIEILGYFIPWLDNLLDSIATPTAVIAGVIVSASVFSDMSPLLKWALAIILGGGTAALVQGTTVVTRAASTATTGGCANPAVAIVELLGSTLLSILAIALPLVAGLVVFGLIYFGGKKVTERIVKRRSSNSA